MRAANSIVDEINPRQPFLWINILGWREILGMIETSSCNVDFVGPFVVLVHQRCSTAIAERPPCPRFRLISAWRSLHELELRTFYYDPSYCLSSGGSPAVGTMTIRPNTDLGRRTEAHLATIAATGNLVLFHAGHYKLRHIGLTRRRCFWQGEALELDEIAVSADASASASPLVWLWVLIWESQWRSP